MSTREALLAVCTLLQRCRAMNLDVYAGVIDYQKTLDYVKHKKLIGIFISLEIDKRDVDALYESKL